MQKITVGVVLALLAKASVAVTPALDPGDPYFDYPSPDPPMTVMCRPMQWLDGHFYLSQGDPSMFVLAFGNPSGSNPRDPHLMLALPNGVRIAALHLNLTLEKSVPWEGGRVLHDLRLPRPATIYAAKEAAASRGLSVLVVSDVQADAKLPDMVFWFRDGEREGLRSALKLEVLPPIQARMPKEFKVGVMLRKPTYYLRGDGLEELYGSFLKRCGVGWVIGGRNAPTTIGCLKAGLDVASEGGLANGYMLGWGMHPEDVAFYLATGERFRRAVCPTAVYTRHPYIEGKVYRDVIHKSIAKDRTCNHFTANWEPYMFLGKGCFCERCREEFVRRSKLPAAEIRKAWPLGVVKKHRDVWERFFAWQHGQVVITLEKMCQQAGKEVGVESHFFPQIACTQVNPEHRDSYYSRMTDLEQYVKQVRWIQLWGGYMTWDIVKPRRRPVAGRLNLHQHAGMARTWADRHLQDGKRPTISWGHGTYLGATTCTFPEAITFDILCCFLNGIDRTAGYVFPHGYDNRYWAAVAKAADTAAVLEGYVRSGKRTRRDKVEVVTPVPQVEAGSVVQSIEFQSENSRLVAVGNFWRDGEVFFRLGMRGVARDVAYTLWDPVGNRLFAPTESRSWERGSHSGALLHVGRLQWAFFAISTKPPNTASPSTVTQIHIRDSMNQRLPAIQKQCDDSMKIIADMEKARVGEAGDYSKLEPLKLDGLSCAIKDVNEDGKPEIVYARKGEELVVEPAKGARVLHWKLDGFDVAHELGSHTLAVDATWAPAHFVIGEVKVIEHKVTKEGMLLTTERMLPKAARGCLSGIEVTRTLLVPKTPGSFRVTTCLTNTEKELKEFAYRHTATPSFLTRTTEDEGWVRLWGAEGPIEFKRNFLKNAYHLAGQPKVPRLDTYAMDVSRTVAEPRVRFGCGWSPVEVEARVQDGKLYKFVFWDSGAQAASTAEFVCQNLKLKPGQSWSVTVDWARVK